MSTAAVTDPTEARRQRGLAIAAVTRIEERKAGMWSVPSQKGTGNYWVRLDLEQPTCTCPGLRGASRSRASTSSPSSSPRSASPGPMARRSSRRP